MTHMTDMFFMFRTIKLCLLKGYLCDDQTVYIHPNMT